MKAVARAATTSTSSTATPAPIPRYRLRVRVITEYAWHNLFARNMFVREETRRSSRDFAPDFTVIDLPGVHRRPGARRHRTPRPSSSSTWRAAWS